MNDTNHKPKILVILGPTATGKSDLAVRLAKKFNGEVVSADATQIYTGLDIGSGKISKKEMSDIPHHMIDIISPINKKSKEIQMRRKYTVAKYQTLAYNAIDKILAKNKLPIVAGGTAFYIQAIVDGIILPTIEVDPALRLKLEQKSIQYLQKKLKKLDPKRYSKIDTKNKVRLVRSIEIALKLGSVPPLKSEPRYNALQIGLNLPNEVLYEKIKRRLQKRLRAGMLNEAKALHEKGLSWVKMRTLGIEYKYQADFLLNIISKEKMCEEIINKSRQFAKRQMTWFKKDKRIKWFHPSEFNKISKLVETISGDF